MLTLIKDSIIIQLVVGFTGRSGIKNSIIIQMVVGFTGRSGIIPLAAKGNLKLSHHEFR